MNSTMSNSWVLILFFILGSHSIYTDQIHQLFDFVLIFIYFSYSIDNLYGISGLMSSENIIFYIITEKTL